MDPVIPQGGGGHPADLVKSSGCLGLIIVAAVFVLIVIPHGLVPAFKQTHGPTASEQQLISMLNPNDVTDCTGRHDLESDGIVAAINCSSVEDGPTDQLLIEQFSDINSSQRWFAKNTADFSHASPGDYCDVGYGVGSWTYNGKVAGRIGCDFSGIVWTIDSVLVGVIANGSNATTMYEWWQNSSCIVFC